MKVLISILLLVFIFNKVSATEQYPDKIHFNNKEYYLLTNPLEKYFEKYKDKRPEGGVISSALRRGYVATFEIIDNQLYIKDVQIETWNEKNFHKEWESVINEIFSKEENRKANWFNGILIFSYGELIDYGHMGYGFTYENYILIEVESGKTNNLIHLNYKEYDILKEKHFVEYKKTKEYIKQKNELKKKGWKQKDIDSFLNNYIIEYFQKLLID